MFLGKLAIGALDRRSVGAPRHPQDLIGVAHPSHLLQGNYILYSGPSARFDFIWDLLHLGSSWHFCNVAPALSPASTASTCEFPTCHGRSGRRRPAASFPTGR